MSEEGLRRTQNKLIHIGSPIPFDTDEFLEQLRCLMAAAYENEEDIRDIVAEIVPTYHPSVKIPVTVKCQEELEENPRETVSVRMEEKRERVVGYGVQL